MARCRNFISLTVIIAVVMTSLTPVRAASVAGLPNVGTMVNLSGAYTPLLLKGVRVNPNNPLVFDFIVDTGNSPINNDSKGLRAESEKLIKYFLATLTIPEKDLWVNLSPYEKDRIIEEPLGQTELGRDMLAQDYMLKQLTASLIYPEKELGKKFWDKIYAQVQQQYPQANIPVNTFNKVWILPDQADIVVNNNTAYVVNTHLKILLEEDYLATKVRNAGEQNTQSKSPVAKLTQQAIRDVILPEIEREVNTGKNFAPLRQIFNSIVLASWYKQNLKEALLNQVYTDKAKIDGVTADDKAIKEKIYAQYLQAYKKGVFNYIKETESKGQAMPRKYFSGGENWAMSAATRPQIVDIKTVDRAQLGATGNVFFVNTAIAKDAPMTVSEAAEATNSLRKTKNLDLARKVYLWYLGQRMHAADENVAFNTASAARLLNAYKDRHATTFTKDDIERILDFANTGVYNPADAAMDASESDILRRLDIATAHLTKLDAAYLKALYFKYIQGREELKIGETFLPSALLSAQARKDYLGVTDSKDIVGNPTYQAAARNLELNVIQMNGGLGTSYKRLSAVTRITGRTTLAAKSSDSFFENVDVAGFDKNGKSDTKKMAISVGELKLLHYLYLGTQGHFQSVVVHDLVNDESLEPIKNFYDSVYLMDKVDDRIPQEKKRTYRQVFSQTQGVKLSEEMIVQGVLPVVDASTKDFILNPNATAPGGHGFLGTLTLERISSQAPAKTKAITAIVNGDGVNNMMPSEVAGWMVSNNIPIVMMTTTKTVLDLKGGLVGLESLSNVGDSIRGMIDKGIPLAEKDMKALNIAPQLWELAQAKTVKQEPLFEAMGIHVGENGGQLFNTNLSAYNEDVLMPFLRDLKAAIGEDKYFAITTPDLIANAKKKAIDGKDVEVLQMEGAKGSALLNLNRFVMTTDDPNVLALKAKYKITRLVYFVNFDAEHRIEVFTPEKYAWDHGLYDLSDMFKVNPVTGRLDRVVQPGEQPGHLPGLELDDYYTDVENVNKAFGHPSMSKLDYLEIKGKVHFADAVLVGKVYIDSKFKGVVDLNEHKAALGQAMNERLVLNNVRIAIDENGKVTVTKDAAMSEQELDGDIDRKFALLNDLRNRWWLDAGDAVQLHALIDKREGLLRQRINGDSPVDEHNQLLGILNDLNRIIERRNAAMSSNVAADKVTNETVAEALQKAREEIRHFAQVFGEQMTTVFSKPLDLIAEEKTSHEEKLKRVQEALQKVREVTARILEKEIVVMFVKLKYQDAFLKIKTALHRRLDRMKEKGLLEQIQVMLSVRETLSGLVAQDAAMASTEEEELIVEINQLIARLNYQREQLGLNAIHLDHVVNHYGKLIETNKISLKDLRVIQQNLVALSNFDAQIKQTERDIVLAHMELILEGFSDYPELKKYYFSHLDELKQDVKKARTGKVSDATVQALKERLERFKAQVVERLQFEIHARLAYDFPYYQPDLKAVQAIHARYQALDFTKPADTLIPELFQINHMVFALHKTLHKNSAMLSAQMGSDVIAQQQQSARLFDERLEVLLQQPDQVKQDDTLYKYTPEETKTIMMELAKRLPHILLRLEFSGKVSKDAIDDIRRAYMTIRVGTPSNQQANDAMHLYLKTYLMEKSLPLDVRQRVFNQEKAILLEDIALLDSQKGLNEIAHVGLQVLQSIVDRLVVTSPVEEGNILDSNNTLLKLQEELKAMKAQIKNNAMSSATEGMRIINLMRATLDDLYGSYERTPEIRVQLDQGHTQGIVILNDVTQVDSAAYQRIIDLIAQQDAKVKGQVTIIEDGGVKKSVFYVLGTNLSEDKRIRLNIITDTAYQTLQKVEDIFTAELPKVELPPQQPQQQQQQQSAPNGYQKYDKDVAYAALVKGLVTQLSSIITNVLQEGDQKINNLPYGNGGYLIEFDAINVPDNIYLRLVREYAIQLNKEPKTGKWRFVLDFEGKDRREMLEIELRKMRHALEVIGTAHDPSLSNKAQLANPGGIDFNPKAMTTNVTGEKVSIKFDAAMIEQFKKGDFTGVRPVILNVTPMQSVLPLLGLATQIVNH